MVRLIAPGMKYNNITSHWDEACVWLLLVALVFAFFPKKLLSIFIAVANL